ncbi:membrane protein [Clostridioides difficile]|nr:membrane protein [Clostridioides difficile]
MSEKVNVKTVISFAGAYVATVIGSGFATGQEIMQFFSFYGFAGIIGGIISMVLFSWMGASVMSKGKELQLKEPIKIYRVYCGKYLGIFFEWFGPLFLFGVFVVMISGAGATLTEYYGLNPFVGRVGMAVVALLTVSLGLDKLSKILGGIGPIIIIFTLLVGGISLAKNIGNIGEAAQVLSTVKIAKPVPNAYLSGVIYTTYNTIVVMAFLTGL